MPSERHPVLEKIDIDAPFFRRSMIREGQDETHCCELQLWLPVQLDNGEWVSAVRVTGIDMPFISAMPGADPLGALIGAMAFARDVMDRQASRFLFGDREAGGLPVFLDRGFTPEMLARVEAQALRMADDAESKTMEAS